MKSRPLLFSLLILGVLILVTAVAMIGAQHFSNRKQTSVASEKSDTTEESQQHIETKPALPSQNGVAKSGLETSPGAGITTDSNAREEAEQKLRMLDDVMLSKNDNDARLDKELRMLNEETRRLFRDKYKSLPLERRNDRGLIVFLLGRNLSKREDFEFLQQVVSEEPCLSLADCQQVDRNSSHDSDHQSGNAIVLVYPQLVAIKALSKYLSGENSANGRASPAADELRTQALDALADARHSKNLKIASLAASVETRSRK